MGFRKIVFFILSLVSLSFVLIQLTSNPTLASKEKRVALIIANGAYKNAPLNNPVNDANDMAEALKQCDFTVMKTVNATRSQMRRAIRKFGNKIKGGGVGLFYYAGHGIQVDGENYLIPIGAEVRTEDEVPDECLRVSSVLRKMHVAGNRLNIIMLDACRDNPFKRSFRSSRSGLAKMDAPTGSILAYATAPGSVASEGTGRNGLYTSKLLKYILQPDLEVEKLFKFVRIDVMNATGNRQVPWESSSLTGSFSFNTRRGIAVIKKPEPVPIPKTTIKTAPALKTPVSESHDKYFKLMARTGFEDAYRYFEDRTRRDNEDMVARSGLMLAMVFKGDKEGAAYHYNRLRETDTKTPYSRVGLGVYQAINGNYNDGVYHFRRAEESNADKALVALCRAKANFNTSKYRKTLIALKNYEKEVQPESRSPVYKNMIEYATLYNKLIGEYTRTHMAYINFFFSIAFYEDETGTFKYRTSSPIGDGGCKDTLQSFFLKDDKINFRLKRECTQGAYVWYIFDNSGKMEGNIDKILIEQKLVDSSSSTAKDLIALRYVVLHRKNIAVSKSEVRALNPGAGTCFIATAAYGSSNEKHVLILRAFRDKFLINNAPGRWFVRNYYTYSPLIAEKIAPRPLARAVVRYSLYPAVVVAGALLMKPFYIAVMIGFITVLLMIFILNRHGLPVPKKWKL
jgi:hypothetical protein